VKSFLSLRSWAALGSLAAAFIVLLGAFVLLRGGSNSADPAPMNVELVARTESIAASDNWAIVDGK